VKTLPRADAVIVGGGWTGLLMAKELGARTALSVVVLERGGPHKTSDYAEGMDEVDYSLRLRMMQDASRETVTFRPTVKERALPIRQFGSFLPGTGTGGAGEHWTGLTPRFLPDCFEIHTRTVERYGAKRWSHSTRAPKNCWACPERPVLAPSKARAPPSIPRLR